MRRAALAAVVLVACAGQAEDETVAEPVATYVAPPVRDASVPPRGLSPDQIRGVVMAHTAQLRRCYDVEATTAYLLFVVAWRIAVDGSVSSVTAVHPTGIATMDACLTREVASWTFPSSDGPTHVSQYPFKFGLRDAGTRD